MPTFKRIPWHEAMKDDEMILSTFKLNVHKQSRTAAVKWLAEIAHSNPAWMNPETAAKLGVKTGDLVRIESARRPSGHQGLRHRRHPSEGGVDSDRLRPLGIRPPGNAQAEGQEGDVRPRPGRSGPQQRLVG